MIKNDKDFSEILGVSFDFNGLDGKG